MAPSLGKDFPAQYKKLLIATGCQEAEAAVKSTLGQDLTTPDFWNKSLDIVEQRVERYKELAAQELTAR
jgi:oligoendopeptidase F